MMVSNHLQSYITLGPAHWICAQPAPRGYKVVEIRGVHVEQLDSAPTKAEAEALVPVYAALVAAGLVGA